ncbi:MAG TPA: MBL fold hydrolase [Deltaproteobacteria bacterium]|nr:MBL fold hydrolase [Deltaproteobacteria bacterium]
MKIRFLGAARQVTGTCFHLSINGTQILIDCGMQQGEHGSEGNRSRFLFSPPDIDYLILTHAHIDHSGLIPKLVKEGFKGPIITGQATADLVTIMLYDSAHIQEKDAEWLTKKAFRAGKEEVVQPLYTSEDVKAAVPLLQGKRYGEIVSLGKGVTLKFWDAGHILGSGSVEMWYQDGAKEKKIVFSGDIGKKDNPIINDPEHTEIADYVVMESTYGNRLHKSMPETIDELVEAIKTTFKKGGNVLMPAFAVGRTQDLLYILNGLVREGRLRPIEVYIDSPLANEATKVYLSHPEVFDREASKLFSLDKVSGVKLHFTESVQESQAINRIKSGVVIIAGSGMCEGGRIVHHFKHNLWRPECSIIFTGFQARGTLGRRIVDGATRVKVLGEDIALRAKVYTIGGFSAHADRAGLLEWLGSFKSRPEVFIVHGEEDTALDFEKAVREQFGFVTYVPKKGEEYEI